MRGFRHLDYPPETDVTELGPAALDEILDRGDLETWAPIAAAIRAEPHGRLADAVVRLLEAQPRYGTSKLWGSWIERLRESPAGGLQLKEARSKRGLTQRAVGERMGISQSDVSKLERRPDLRLSTLRSYLEATGGKLEVWVVYDEGRAQARFRLD